MPELTKEYIEELLPRLETLSQSGNLCTIETDDGLWLLCEIWHFPERKETKPEGEYEIYPFAKLLSEEEVAGYKMGGIIPKLSSDSE